MKKKSILISSMAISFVFAMSVSSVSAADVWWQHVEDLSVPANASTPTIGSTLITGNTYRVTVEGTAMACSAGSCNIEFDAEYSTSDDGAEWVDGVASPYDIHGADLLDLKVNGDFVDWGEYNADHKYVHEFVSNGDPVNFMVYDVYYPNNTEELSVKIEVLADGYVHGGGQIIEEDGDKSKDWYKVSFGGAVAQFGNDYVGEWEVNLHNVGDDNLDKSKFHTTKITKINFFDGGGDNCSAAMNFYAEGKFNGESGHKMIFRAGDDVDTARVTISKSGKLVYDTHTGGEFSNESKCVGTARTGLDRGNITIVK